MLIVVFIVYALWAETLLSRKILCFLILMMFVFFSVVVHHYTDNDKSQLLPQDI